MRIREGQHMITTAANSGVNSTCEAEAARSDREWVTERAEGKVTVHTLVIGGVLCRWWGDGEPPAGVALLQKLAGGSGVPDATPQ